jgi:hypothetical protein
MPISVKTSKYSFCADRNYLSTKIIKSVFIKIKTHKQLVPVTAAIHPNPSKLLGFMVMSSTPIKTHKLIHMATTSKLFLRP